MAHDIVVRDNDLSFIPKAKREGDAAGDVKAYLRQSAYNEEANQVDLYEKLKNDIDSALSYLLFNAQTNLLLDGKAVGAEALYQMRTELEEGKPAEHVILFPKQKFKFDLGFKIALEPPADPRKLSAIEIIPRSGLGCDHLLIIPNSPGLIDQNYRGWVMCTLYPLGGDIEIFSHGARIAQAKFVEVYDTRAEDFFEVVESLPESNRGEAGFNSSGVKDTVKVEPKFSKRRTPKTTEV